jgi:hypothetical protein
MGFFLPLCYIPKYVIIRPRIPHKHKKKSRTISHLLPSLVEAVGRKQKANCQLLSITQIAFSTPGHKVKVLLKTFTAQKYPGQLPKIGSCFSVKLSKCKSTIRNTRSQFKITKVKINIKLKLR